MARNYQTNLIIGGDSRGGLRAMRTVQGELDKTQRSGGRLRREFQQLNRRSQALQRSVTRLGGALVAAFSVGAAVRGIQQLAAEADQIGKTAQNIGIAAEALQELRGAGELSGVSIQQIDDALRRFNRRLGLFVADGAGPAAKAIDRLGLSVLDSQGKFRGTEVVLNETIDAIAALPTVAEQAAAASELFGDDAGPKLVTLLSQGSAGVAELRRQIRETGGVISQEGIDTAQRYQDQLTLLQGRFRGVSVQILEGLLPALEGTFSAFQQVEREGNGLTNAGQRIGEAFNVIIRAGIVVRETLLAIGEALLGLAVATVGAVQQIVAPLTGFITAAQNATDALLDGDFARARDAVAGLGAEITADFADAQRRTDRGLQFIGESVAARVQDAVDGVNRIADGLDNVGGSAGVSTREFGDFNLELERTGDLGADTAEELEKLAEQQQRFVDATADLQAKLAGGAATALRDYQQGAQEVGEAFRAGIITQDQAIQRLDLLTQRFREQIAPLVALQQRVGELALQYSLVGSNAADAGGAVAEFTNKLAEGLQQGLERGLSNGINQISAQDVLDGNFSEIGSQLGQTLAVSIGQGIGTAFGGPVGGAIGSLIGDILGQALFGGSVPKFQVRGRNATRATDEGTDVSVAGPLGQIDFAFREIEAETRVAVQNAFVEFDTQIASFIRDTDQLTSIENALDQLGVSSRSDGESIEGLLQIRFDTILSTFDQVTQDVVRAAGQTLEAQVQALADIQSIAVQESLGRGLGLDNALGIISELQVPGEQLAATFDRLRTAATLLDQTMAVTGATFGDTREEVLRFGQDLADAFGGDLQRAGGLLSTIFSTFFTEAERLEARVEQSTARAVDLLAQLGIDATEEILTQGGFRELFDSLVNVLPADQLAILLEAGGEIAALIDAEARLADVRGESVTTAAEAAEAEAARNAEIRAFLTDIGQGALQIIAPARAEYAQLAAQIQANEVRARELGLSEQQLNLVRIASEVQLRGFIASLSESIASLTQQLFGAGPQIDAIGGTLNVAANAATNFRDQWLSAIDSINNALDAQLLGPNSTLTAAERQQASLQQFQEALSAAQGGDLGAAQSLPQLFQQALAQGASFFGSTSGEFAALEQQLRTALETADLPVPPAGPEVQTAQNTAAVAASSQVIETNSFQQLAQATQLIDQIGLLADITGSTPVEIGTQFGVPIAELIEILTGEAPTETAEALRERFNELATSIGQDLNELAGIEAIGADQLAVLQDIRALLGGEALGPPGFAGPAPDPGFASGGIAGRNGPQRIIVGEAGPEAILPAPVTSFLQRVGIPVNGNDARLERRMARIESVLTVGNQQREAVLVTQREGIGASVAATRDLRDELRKRTSAGKPALTRA